MDPISTNQFRLFLGKENPSRKTPTIVVVAILLFLSLLYFLFNYYILTPPKHFPVETPITIQTGASAKEIAELLEKSGFINSKISFYFSLWWWHKPSDLKASSYIFSSKLSAKDLLSELTAGHFSNNLIRLTLIEGERAELIAKRASLLLPNFKTDDFLRLATPVEGTLFPETYLIPSTYTAEDLFTLLRKTYQDKMLAIRPQLSSTTLSEAEVINLASIIEREANSPESMRLVSGILQKRLSLHMPLQVDATLEYVLDKPLADLVADDLAKANPYNTYKNAGLPPTPIGNPGMQAIEAVLHPEVTRYLFYITDADGQFHYAESFSEHKNNIAKYLR